MNNQLKVLLTINGIEGATLHSKGKSKIPFVIRKKDLDAKEYTGKNADKIIVLDNGDVVGMGTHADLMKNCEM